MIETNKKRIINLLTIAVLLFSSSGLWAQGCPSMPAPVSYAKVGSDVKFGGNKIAKTVGQATVNGVVVTRTLENDRKLSYDFGVKYSDGTDAVGDTNPCGNNTKSKHGYPIMDSNRVRKLTYKFSKPVTDIELFFAEFGYKQSAGLYDYADIVLKSHGNVVPTQLTIRNDCNNGATKTTKNGKERLASLSGKVTDVKAGITSDEPFDEMILENASDNTGYGFYVEICLNSIQPLDISACNPGNINNNFTRAITATKTLNGVEVERILDANQFANIGTSSYCGSFVTYPNNLPYMGNTGARKLTYKFNHPVTSAEIFLFAFGESEDTTNPNRYDKVKFSVNGGGTMTLSQTYNCIPTGTTVNSSTGEVKSADNKLITTDVGIKVTSTKPFTEIVLEDKTPSEPFSGRGYVVEICASSITKADVNNFITLDTTASTLTNQTICEGEAPVYNAKADATAFAATAKFDYILEAKKSGATSWVAVETKSDVAPGTLHTFTGDALKTTDYNNAEVRVKYVYKNSLFPSVTGAAYSNKVTLTVKDKASITSLTASPTSLNKTGATNIVYTIKGTPGATVTYNINGTTGTKVLDSAGNGTVPANGKTTKTTLTITKVEKTGLCSRENLGYKAEVDQQGNSCTSHPTPQFAKANNAKATLNGVEVTRTVEGTPYYYPATTYPASANFCTPTIMEGHPVMSEDGFNKITYTFAKPISKVQVWLSGFGGALPHSDSAQFSVECTGATPNLSLSVTDCNNTAESNLVTKSGNQITSKQGKYFQAIVQVSADKPFTKLVVSKVDANSFKADGYSVELCPTSVKLPEIAVTQEPADKKACAAQTGISFTANAKMEGVTGDLSVQWQRTKTPATETSWANAPGTASGTVKADGTGSTTLTLPAIVAADKDYYYRAQFSYNACGTAITQASDKAKLEIPSDSDIITIQATQPVNVTTNNCTGTTTINAQAKIASGYTIKNSGGNIFGYFLEYKDSNNAWQTYNGQQYSNNTSEQARTLSIAHSSAPAGVTTFRVRYTVTLTTDCVYTLFTNEFTFTKNLPAEPVIATPQTFCQSENKTLAGLTTLPNIKWYNAISGGTEVLSSTVIPVGTNNYWATVTTNGCESTRKQVTVTIVAKPTAPTVQTKTECPATGNYDMAGLVTSAVPTGHTLKWYDSATATTTAASTVSRNKTAKTTYEKWVALATPQGCESDRVKVTYIVDITTPPTIAAPASNLSINCADPAATVTSQVNTWLGTATATMGCGTPTVTNDYAAVKPADLCSVGEIEVTFTVTDAFGTQKTVKKKITVDRLIANNDTESVSRSTGEDIDVLANDTKNGQPATKDNVNVQIVNANGTGATVTPDGKIRIPGGTLTPGLHNITYKICDKDNPSRCGATATLAVTITNSTIEANNDTPAPLTYATSVAYAKNTDGTELNVLANDKLSGVAPTLSQVTIIPVATATGVSIEPATGKVKVNASTPAGVYDLTYKIKENGTSNESTPAKVTVVVKNTLNATPATLTPAITPSTSATTPKVIGDVLDQTTLNGSKPNTNEVTISVTQQATPPVTGDPVPEINTTTGKVEIPSGVKPGSYTIKYKVCDKATGIAQTCKDVTLPITVAGGNTIVAQDDDFSAYKVERSASEEVVKNGSNPVNVLTNDKLDTRTGLDTNVVTITQTSPASAVNIDTATGQIKVAANATAGVYEVKYKITEKGQTTASNEATAKVVVTNKVELTPATIPSTVNPPTNTTPETIANVLDNAKINGSVPTTTNAKVEVVTPAPAAPGEVVPYVDPATGNVVVPPGTKVGNHSITYKVCDKVPAGQEAAQTCKTATITIPVTGNTITPDDDNFSAYKVEHPTVDTFVTDGTNPVNVLTNDKLGARTGLTTDLVTITPTVTNPNVSIDTDSGKVKVKANTPAGEYTIKYKITEKGQTTASDEKEVKVVVTNSLVNDDANYGGAPSTTTTPADGGNVLDNVRINGSTSNPSPTDVDITINQTAGSGTVPYLETSGADKGKIKLPQGTPSGTYTIKYTVCDTATGAAKSCKQAIATVVVNANAIIATNDTNNKDVEFNANTAQNVKEASNNDLNVLDNDKLGATTGLNNTQVTIQTTQSEANITIQPDGKVQVGAGKAAGVYELKYKIKEVADPTNISGEAKVKVVVKNKVTNDPFPTTPVKPSTDNNTPAERINILDKVKINGNTPTINDVTIEVTDPADPQSPGDKVPELDTTTGKIKVPAGVKPGAYQIKYKVCDKVTGEANSCVEHTITVNVAGNDITAVADDFTAHKVERSNTDAFVNDGTNDVNVLTNDKLGARTGLDTNVVTITQTDTTEPKVTVEADGRVKVAADAPAGTHTVKYTITEKGQTTPSNEVEVKVVVTNKIELTPNDVVSNPVTPSTDSTTPKEIGDVLDGTKLNGAKPTIGTGPNQVTVTVTNPATSPVPGDPVPELDTTTGKVKIPAGVKPGNYNITYKVCDNATPQTCESTTVTVQVQGNTTTAVADDFSAHKVEHPTTNTFVKDGTNDVNVLSNDKLGNNSNISTNEVTITQTATSDPKVTINTATGKVKVAANTPAGEYTVKYKFTEKGQPATQASAEKEVKVVVTNKLVNNNANYSGAASTNSTPTNAGNVLDNVRINDATSNPAPSDVTISVDVPATGTKVPYLETSGPDAGKIKIPQGTPSGPYTIKYTVCDKAPGASKSCKQATATVTVGANPIVVNPTTKRVPKTGGSVDVLDNATIGGNPANKNNVDVSIVNDGGTGATVDPATGKINVPSGLAPGTHTITYKVCEKGSTTNCQTSTLKVVIPSDIVVNPAPNAVIPKTGGTADVLDNTTVNGHPATKDKVDVSIVNDGGTGATVDPATGKINVPGGLAPGEYTITYKVCEKGQTDNCKTGTLKVVIPADIVLNPDGDKTVPKTGGTVDVLGNDTVNGNPATKDNVDISIVDPDGTSATIDPATGKIVVPNGAAPGTHTIRYRVCEKGTNRCKEGSVKVVVAQENIAANPDNYEEPWSNADRVAKAAGNVDANILTNDQLGSRTALNTTLVDIEQVDASSDKVSVDPATGKVTIKANTPGGTYTVKYRIKPKGQTTPVSTPATVTVVVKNKVEVTDNEISGKPSENNSPREIGNVTDNVKINGQKPSPSGVTIEVINPAAPVRPGAHVPRVDTTTGKIIVDKDVPAGDYTIKVKVCDKATPKTCVEKDLRIKVKPNQNLEAINDVFNIGTTGGTTPSVLDNDKWKNEAGKLKTDGSDSDELKVKVVPTLGKNQPDPTRVILATDGRITVKPGLAPGRYTYYYTIISAKEPSMSSSAEAVINISSYIAGEDTVVADKPKEGEEVTSQESVLDNDTLNGVKPTPDTVEISLISVSPSAKGKIELDTTTGKIKLKSGVPVGEHTVKYKVCIKGTTTCQEGEAKVKVQPNLTLKEHTFDKPINSALSETHTDSVLTGSTLDGQPIKPADVTTRIVTNGGLTGAKTDADGQIVIPKGTPSGTYTLEYEVTSKEYGVKKTAKVTVTINNDATLEFYNAISTDEGSQNNGFIIKNIDLYPNNNLKIFNRYGVLVYEKDGYTNADPFKGFSTGRATVNKDGKLPQGTYYYVLEYTDGQNQNQQKAGWLYIK